MANKTPVFEGSDSSGTVLDEIPRTSLGVGFPTTARFFLVAAVLVAGYLGFVELGKVPDLEADPAYGAYGLLRDSRWGQLFGVPIAFAGAVLYGLVLLYSDNVAARKPGGTASVGLGLASLTTMTAIYYTILQHLLVGGLCSWCGIAHCLAAGGVCLLLCARFQLADRSGSARDWFVGFAIAGGGLAALALTQSLQQDRPVSVLVNLDPAKTSPHAEAFNHQGSKLVSLFEGRIIVNPAHFPVIGPRSAENFIVAVMDYTSPACRGLHRRLAESQRAYGDKLALIEMPGALTPEATEIHRSMLTLRELRAYEFDALSETIYASEHLGELKNDYVIREILKRVPEKEFLEARVRFAAQIEYRIGLGRQVQHANAVYAGSTELPQLIVGSEVATGVSADRAFYPDLVRRNLGLPVPSSLGDVSGPGNSPPIAQVEKATIDLGKVAPGAEIPIMISVTNSGESPLQITWVRFESDCRPVEIPQSPIFQHQSADVELALLTPVNRLGRFERTVTVHSNASLDGNTVRIVGEIDPGQTKLRR